MSRPGRSPYFQIHNHAGRFYNPGFAPQPGKRGGAVFSGASRNVLVNLNADNFHNLIRLKVEEISGENLDACYQCGKCSAGCPSAFVMDLLPHRLIRDLQLGITEQVLASNTPWVCASCEACSVRCPRGIEVARVMEALRQMPLRARRDRVEIEALPPETLRKAPPIALVACFRKTTS